MKNKLIVMLLVLIMIIPISVANAAVTPDSNIKVLFNGQKMTFEINPVIKDGVTLVQFRTIFKAIGLKYTWDNATQTIVGSKDDMSIKLEIGSNVANVNGRNIKLNVAPMILNNYTLVPLRFVSEATGMDVKWNNSTKTITIDSSSKGKVIESAELLPYMGYFSWEDSEKTVVDIEGKDYEKNYFETLTSLTYYREFFGESGSLRYEFDSSKLNVIS